MSIRWFLALCVVMPLMGCSDAGVKVVAVQGTVTLDNKPLVSKTLRFFPEPGTPGVGAGATTNEQGVYQIIAVRPGSTTDVMGVPPGAYRVTVAEPMFPIELEVQDSSATEATPAIGLPSGRPKTKAGQQKIPPRYTDVSTTPLQVTVPEAGGDIPLVLTTKP